MLPKRPLRQKQADDDGGYARAGVRIVFGSRDRDIIRDYYRDQYSDLPPGLAKRGGNLPPGLQKHLERMALCRRGCKRECNRFPMSWNAACRACPMSTAA